MHLASIEHHCQAMPKAGIHINCEPDQLPGDSWCWALCVERTATEQDLEESNILEQVGESVWSLTVGISHCPYCGVLLPNEPSDAINRNAAFRLVDFRIWNYTVSESIK